MQTLHYGRKIFSFDKRGTVLKSTVVTERARPGENEAAFTQRLLQKYQDQEGIIQIVFKRGCPDYAIISFGHELDGDLDA